nr:phasin family protein [uncultured Gellertiella sp.]
MFNFDEASRKGKDVMDGMLKSYAEVSRGFQALATEAADFSRKSYEQGIAHVEAISSVKSPESAFELQAAFVKSSYQTAMAEMTRIGELYADLAKTAYKPFETPVAKAATVNTAPVQAGAEIVSAA